MSPTSGRQSCHGSALWYQRVPKLPALLKRFSYRAAAPRPSGAGWLYWAPGPTGRHLYTNAAGVGGAGGGRLHSGTVPERMAPLSEQASAPLRTAAIAFLNAAPLMAGLDEDPALALTYTAPSACADALARGEADLGLIPVVELLRVPGLAAVAALGVAARRQVRSILLLTRSRLENVRQLWLDPASRTSSILAQLLLRERFGARIERTHAGPAATGALPPGTARLVIGDPALQLSVRGTPAGLTAYDLAAAWYEWTGLPFVFALWGVRQAAVAGREAWLVQRLQQARARGTADHEALVQQWSARLALPEVEIRRYLREDVEYDLDEDHMRGLRHFVQAATTIGLLPPAPLPPLLGAGPNRLP